MSHQATVTNEQILLLQAAFNEGKPAFLIAKDNCPSRLTAGKQYDVLGTDGNRVVLREDDGDRIRVGRDSDWMNYFYAAMSEAEIAAAEAAAKVKEAQRLALETKTTDELLSFIRTQRTETELAVQIVRNRTSGVI